MMRFITILLLSLAVPVASFGADANTSKSGAGDFGDSEAGRQTANQVCAVCHGTDGNSPLSANPNLAGQHAEYLYKQLVEFKSGARANAIMAGMVANLSDDDMRNLATFYAEQTAKDSSASDLELATKGQKLYRGGVPDKGIAACMACHSPDGSGIPPVYPRLSLQHAEYTTAQLRAFRAGNRNNDANGMMRMVAQRLSDEEIEALAEYLSGLR
jgi:cytochrome c553